MGFLVDGPRDELFAAAGFTGDEHGRVRRRYSLNERQYLSQGGRRPDDLLEHRRTVDFFAQRQVLVANPVLPSLAVVDVGRGGVPAHNATVLVTKRAIADEEPSVHAIVTPGPLFVL